MNTMFEHVHRLRERFYLFVNMPLHSAFSVWDNDVKGWQKMVDTIYCNRVAAIRDNSDLFGEQVNVASARGQPVIVFVANRLTNKTVGRVEIDRFGAMSVHDSPNFTVEEAFAPEWCYATTIVLGIPEPRSMTIFDSQGSETDIIRMEKNKDAWIVPERYLSPSQQYDMLPEATETEQCEPMAMEDQKLAQAMRTLVMAPAPDKLQKEMPLVVWSSDEITATKEHMTSESSASNEFADATAEDPVEIIESKTDISVKPSVVTCTTPSSAPKIKSSSDVDTEAETDG